MQGVKWRLRGAQLSAQGCRDQTRSLALWVQLVVAPTLAPTPHLSTKTFCSRRWCSRARRRPSMQRVVTRCQALHTLVVPAR